MVVRPVHILHENGDWLKGARVPLEMFDKGFDAKTIGLYTWLVTRPPMDEINLDDGEMQHLQKLIDAGWCSYVEAEIRGEPRMLLLVKGGKDD